MADRSPTLRVTDLFAARSAEAARRRAEAEAAEAHRPTS